MGESGTQPEMARNIVRNWKGSVVSAKSNIKQATNVVPLILPRSRPGQADAVVHARRADGILTLTVEFIGLPASEQIGLYACVTLADGRALPAWFERTASNQFAGRPPPSTGTLELIARAWRTEEGRSERRFRIDTDTGAIVWSRQPDAAPPPLFGEQLARFSELGDAGAGHLAGLLGSDGINSS